MSGPTTSPPAPPLLWGLAVGIATVPAFVGYRMTEGVLLGAGWSRWPAIGVASLGGLLGAAVGGVIIYFVLSRMSRRPDAQ